MRLRVIFYDSVILLLWAFVCFFFLGTIGFNIVFDAFGLFTGFVFGAAVTLKQLSFLKEKGEIRVTLKTLAYVLLIIITVVPISLYLVLSLGLETGIKMLNFIYPSIPAFYAARIALYSNWERKHEKHILFKGPMFTGVYAVPRDLEK